MVSKEGFDDESKPLRTVFSGNFPLKIKKLCALFFFLYYRFIVGLPVAGYRKIFIGGLSRETTLDTFVKYFGDGDHQQQGDAGLVGFVLELAPVDLCWHSKVFWSSHNRKLTMEKSHGTVASYMDSGHFTASNYGLNGDFQSREFLATGKIEDNGCANSHKYPEE